MNIYDKQQEAFNSYISDPEAAKHLNKTMTLICVYLISLLAMITVGILNFEFYRGIGGYFFLFTNVIVLSIFALLSNRSTNRYLSDFMLYHNYLFYLYKTNKSGKIVADLLVNMAVADILIGNYDNEIDALA